MSAHPDRDLLAAYAAGEPPPGVDTAHLASCAACRAEVEALRRVVADLAALPRPTMPVDVVTALDAAIEAERARPVPGGDVLPLRRRRVPGWVAGAVAASVVAALAGGAVLRLGDRGDLQRTAEDSGGADAAGPRRYRTGFGYTEANLADRAALLLSGDLPENLVVTNGEPGAGTGGAAAPREMSPPEPTGFDSGVTDDASTSEHAARTTQALMTLFTQSGLTACLDQLRDEPGTPEPLALDYATFGGRSALVVLLPYDEDEVDVWVVGARCGLPHATTGVPDADLLHFERVSRPS